ncbi:hypothetical protein [Chryseobacterium taklimakanense]|uniref:Uncharacterized protein n=1 Tax=Chryseobacterium taklimakanense TaxID=536441 RepID=A0A3G8WJY8_9FLAO|nr:hypothetical protein [Chryseobacterium taklimakanense]AZI21500.1 hypothetical protein EIH08_12375 [Chryseobacterium taklimakanense]
MIDYTWVSSVQNAINNNSIFAYTITGAKSLAMAFLLFKIMGHFLQTAENEERPPIGGLINIIGFGLIIVGSDFIVNSIEQLFSGIEVDVAQMNNHNTISPAARQLELINEVAENMGALEKIAFYFAVMPNYMGAIALYFVASLLHLIDVAITSMYLLQRVFLIQLFKFIFPLAIAFSTLDKMSDMLYRWIKVYIGLFVLGIAYIAIIKFSVVVYDTLANKIDVGVAEIVLTTEFSKVFLAELGALLVAFAVKIGLMGFVTKEVRSYFN